MSLCPKLTDMRNTAISDDVAGQIAHVLADLPNLYNLKLCHISSITPSGWAPFSAVMRNCPSLVHIDLGLNKIGDEAAAAFASALSESNNTTLETLNLESNPSIGPVGWQAIADLVCKPRIADALNSNHTLVEIKRTDIPSDLAYYIHLNKYGNHNEIIRKKILRRFFSGSGESIESNVKVFHKMNFAVMPQAIDWIGRDESGRSLFYHLFRSIPSLVERRTATVASSKKRPRDA